jgi:hypothetical protein
MCFAASCSTDDSSVGGDPVGDQRGAARVPKNLRANIDGLPGSWGQRIGGAGFESVGAVAIAPDTSIYIAGSFDETLELGALVATGKADVFVAKLTATGQLVWSTHFGSPGGSAGASKIKVLSNGDLVLGGNYRGSLPLGTTTLASVGDQDAFVARLSPLGVPVWAKSGGGTGYDELDDLSVDPSDNIAVCGSFTDSGTFFGSSTLTGTKDTFLVRLTGAGVHSWSRAMNADGVDNTCGVASMANGDVVYVGNVNGTVDAGGGPLTSAARSLDFYLARYAGATGGHVWSAIKGGNGNDYARDVEASGASIVVTGGFSGSLDLGGSPLNAAGGDDAFVAKFDAANGNHQFSTRFGGRSGDHGDHIAVRSDGQITVAGLYTGTADFGGTDLPSTGDIDPFVVDLDGTTGAVVAVKSVGGTNRDEANDVASSAESLVFAGAFSANITILGQQFTARSLDGHVVRFRR